MDLYEAPPEVYHLNSDRIMTSITTEPVQSHDLRSTEVIKWLKLKDHVIIDEIASRLYVKILQVIDSERPTISDWSKIDEKLKWVLHTQVELLGRLYVCEGLIETLLVAQEDKIGNLLGELSSEFFFLSQDLSGVFYELGYSTWNLLDFLDPDHFFGPREVSPSLITTLDEVLGHLPAKPPALIHGFCERLTENGIDNRSIGSVKMSLAVFLSSVDKYKKSMASFYETETNIEALYNFHYLISTATYLLSICLAMKLVLKPVRNQFQSNSLTSMS